MPSSAYQRWETARIQELNEVEAAHSAVGGEGPGRRHATTQINYAYAMLLSSQFQGFCRDLHDESVEAYVNSNFTSPHINILRKLMREGRKLDRGNPNPGNIGSDFSRFGIAFWDEVRALDRRTQSRQDRLEQLNEWRNAIAHQDFYSSSLGILNLAKVRSFREACHQLTRQFDDVMKNRLRTLTGNHPW